MRKLIIPMVLVMLVLTAIGEAFAQTATVVTRSGQRFRAQLIEMSGVVNQTWTNTGIDVVRGQRIHFRANGNVRLSQNEEDFGTPAGANNGRLAGNSPLPHVTGGMLIGRVGNGRPFVVGAESELTMPASGRLFLGINDDHVQDNSGSFDVQIPAQ